jgi:hypothetical protein
MPIFIRTVVQKSFRWSHFEVSLAVISVNVNAGANRINRGTDKAV